MGLRRLKNVRTPLDGRETIRILLISIYRYELTPVDFKVDHLLDFPAEGELLPVVPLRARLLQVVGEDVVLVAQAAFVGGAVAVVTGDRITYKIYFR